MVIKAILKHWKLLASCFNKQIMLTDHFADLHYTDNRFTYNYLQIFRLED